LTFVLSAVAVIAIPPGPLPQRSPSFFDEQAKTVRVEYDASRLLPPGALADKVLAKIETRIRRYKRKLKSHSVAANARAAETAEAREQLLLTELLKSVTGDDGSWPALLLWIALCASDGIDGWLARRQGVTRSGAFLILRRLAAVAGLEPDAHSVAAGPD